MHFTSQLFLFIFLPITIFLYCILPSKSWRSFFLLISSIIFYAWGEPLFVFLLCFLVILNWFLGIIIDRSIQKDNKKIAEQIKIIAVILNLLPLLILKLLTNRSLINISDYLTVGDLSSFTYPMGLSFFAFTSISYLIDVYRKEIRAENNLFDLSGFLLMFPKISQGPITKYKSVVSGIKKPVVNIDTIANGLRRFIAGLAKKVMVADYLGVVSSKVFSLDPNSLNPRIAWYGLIAFTLQIFLDFSAYTDMAIGLGCILGFDLPENFNFPYISKSITEFWRRWHMTLSNWFRSYLFIPLEISRRKAKRFRLETNIIFVFLATGLWHGIGQNFILWGLYYGVIIALEANFLGMWLKKINPIFQHAITLLLITFGWVFFRIEKIRSWAPFFRSLFGLNNDNIHTLRSLRILAYWPILIIGAILCLPIINIIPTKIQNNLWIRVLTDCLLIILLLVSIAIISSGNFRAFLYAEF